MELIQITINQLVKYIKHNLIKFDYNIIDISIIHGAISKADIPNSLVSTEKAKILLKYKLLFSIN
jgi:UDP-N-acetylglucosamine 4-epimerase